MQLDFKFSTPVCHDCLKARFKKFLSEGHPFKWKYLHCCLCGSELPTTDPTVYGHEVDLVRLGEG